MTEEGFDDVDGAMFSRQISKNSCRKPKPASPLNRSSSDEALSEEDGDLKEDTLKATDVRDGNEVGEKNGELSYDEEDWFQRDKPIEKKRGSSKFFVDINDGLNESRERFGTSDPEISKLTNDVENGNGQSSENTFGEHFETSSSVKSGDEDEKPIELKDIIHKESNEPLLTEISEIPQTAHPVIEENKPLNGNELPRSTVDGKDDQNDWKMTRRLFCQILKCLAVPIISLGLFFGDLFTDIDLAFSYKESGEMDLFYITLACIIGPAIVMAVVDLSWVYIDRALQSRSDVYTAIRILVGVSSFGRVWRAVIYMKNLVYMKIYADDMERKEQYNKHAVREKRDCFMLDFINVFAESCPQLFLQLYLLYKFNLELTIIRVASILFSWVAVAWTYASYYSSHREAKSSDYKKDLNCIGFMLFFGGILSAIAARVICFIFCAVYFKIWIGATIAGCHCFVMLVWIIKQNPPLDGITKSKPGRGLYYLFFSYVSLICFMNLQNTKAKWRMAVFYMLVYLENFVMAAFILWELLTSKDDKDAGKHWNLVVLPIGMALHICCTVLYYKLFHPKTGRYGKSVISCKTICKCCCCFNSP